MEVVFINDVQPLYIFDYIYFPIVESAHVAEAGGPVEGTVFARMADHEGHGEYKVQVPGPDYVEQ